MAGRDIDLEASEELLAEFAEYAEENGIDSEHAEDWQPWWDCFLAGAKAAAELLKETDN